MIYEDHRKKKKKKIAVFQATKWATILFLKKEQPHNPVLIKATDALSV